jgi:hypothetical protein
MIEARRVIVKGKKAGEILLIDRKRIEFVGFSEEMQETLSTGVAFGKKVISPEENPVGFFYALGNFKSGYIHISGRFQK